MLWKVDKAKIEGSHKTYLSCLRKTLKAYLDDVHFLVCKSLEEYHSRLIEKSKGYLKRAEEINPHCGYLLAEKA